MRNMMIVASLLLASTGCGSKDKFDDVLSEMGTIKDKMCACTDKACTDKVQDEWRAYRKSMKDKIGKDAKPSDAQDKKGRELDDDMRKCRHKFEDAAAPAPGGEMAPPAGTTGSAAPAPAPTTP